MKVAIIGAGPMAKIIAEKARQLGVETYCFAWEQGAVAKDAVDHFVDISIFIKAFAPPPMKLLTSAFVRFGYLK